jgi:HKD family nuclease
MGSRALKLYSDREEIRSYISFADIADGPSRTEITASRIVVRAMGLGRAYRWVFRQITIRRAAWPPPRSAFGSRCAAEPAMVGGKLADDSIAAAERSSNKVNHLMFGAAGATLKIASSSRRALLRIHMPTLPGIDAPSGGSNRMLGDISFQLEYRSGRDELVAAFYHPCLTNADTYWRAVGYFSSTALEALGAPLGDFVSRGGTLRLITSVELQERDVEAIKRGLALKDVCEARLLEQIRAEFSGPVARGVVLLTALLEASCMEIRIAMPRDRAGIYHEKVGVFMAQGREEYVAFAGSSNETRHAFEANYECIDVYPSWSEPVRAHSKREHFERLWANTEVGVESMEFPEAVRQELITVVRASIAKRHGALPPDRWRHQDDAVAAFLAAKCGVLEMATGTGKTRVAMRVMGDLAASGTITTIIVSADGTDLLDQWAKQLFGVAAHQSPRWRVLQHFHGHHERSDFLLDPQDSIFVTSRPELAAALKRLRPDARAKTLLVHDEVHRLGSPSNVRELDGLAGDIPYRLGLSARRSPAPC